MFSRLWSKRGSKRRGARCQRSKTSAAEAYRKYGKLAHILMLNSCHVPGVKKYSPKNERPMHHKTLWQNVTTRINDFFFQHVRGDALLSAFSMGEGRSVIGDCQCSYTIQTSCINRGCLVCDSEKKDQITNWPGKLP